MIEAPPDLVAKYRTRAPRYTSYPTAPQFKAIELSAVHAALGKNEGPLCLYVHIPFCRELCLYCGCHVEIKHRRDIGSGYVDLLLRELDLQLQYLKPGRQIAWLALGGGTPTFLYPDDMARLIRGIRARLPFAEGAEASIEIDPRTIDEAYLDTLVEIGFNRFSFGFQDSDPEVLKTVKRNQPPELAKIAAARVGDRFAVNLDLMYGLPHQTEETFTKTLDDVLEIRPTRVALFLYAHVPWMKPAQKLLERAGLPDSALKTKLFALADRRFAEAGYVAVGMDHFALPEDPLVPAWESGHLQRNFMGYTPHAGIDQIGIGVSSIGLVGGAYVQNFKDRDRWTADIEAGNLPVERGLVLTTDDQVRRRVILDLFCNFRVDFPAGDFAKERAALLPLQADGLCTVREDGVDVTPLGRHFIRNICSVFDAYLEADAGERRYSATA